MQTKSNRKPIVPLSAYNIVQEVTYQPNDTLPTVFLGKLVPSVLQNPTDSFTPQQLNVGAVMMLDDHIFNYTIAEAFEGVDTRKPVSSFSYYNNPLSESCDSTNMTFRVLFTYEPVWGWEPDVQVQGTVVCYLPSLFYLAWDALLSSDGEIFLLEEDVTELPDTNLQGMPSLMRDDLLFLLPSLLPPEQSLPGILNLTQLNIGLTVHPCCDCDTVVVSGALESIAALREPSCSSNPSRFVVLDVQTTLIWRSVDGVNESTPGPLPMQIFDVLSPLGNASITVYENLIQAFYHLVRLDLGVILENQIYNSPEMFNRTIMDMGNYSLANMARGSTSNATLMAQWQQEVEFFQSNEQVPALEYLRSVPRLKPVGSAVTSVFVSTFAMLSVIWTVFSLVAGALARAHGDGASRKEITLGQNRNGDKWMESGRQEVEESEVILLDDPREPLLDPVAQLRKRVDKHDIEGVQLRAALARMSAALKKHGIVEDES
ncbi:hypothetical protein MSAN_00265000 [Mycena sanguinolenta]|uniref:Uncharacterized protein n=1 Tax=Mycena sanguinolenta TaxID=230812 RepID=A0A8H7DLD8_9AGAR|nr:hypothetical protein MSAN_00265000 [Mycena sanguinolenta]